MIEYNHKEKKSLEQYTIEHPLTGVQWMYDIQEKSIYRIDWLVCDEGGVVYRVTGEVLSDGSIKDRSDDCCIYVDCDNDYYIDSDLDAIKARVLMRSLDRERALKDFVSIVNRMSDLDISSDDVKKAVFDGKIFGKLKVILREVNLREFEYTSWDVVRMIKLSYDGEIPYKDDNGIHHRLRRTSIVDVAQCFLSENNVPGFSITLESGQTIFIPSDKDYRTDLLLRAMVY